MYRLVLERLQQTRVGCHMGSRFTGAPAYADDITLLALCKSALSILISVCEEYAAEYYIIFNGSRSKLLHFKGRSTTMVLSEVLVNDDIVAISDKTLHLGHTICTKDREDITWPLRTTSGNSLTCLLLILGSYSHLFK